MNNAQTYQYNPDKNKLSYTHVRLYTVKHFDVKLQTTRR